MEEKKKLVTMKRVELDNKKRIELDNKKILLIILIVGVLLRAIVYFFLGPFNNDDHFSVVKFIYDNGVVPVSSLTYQAYHPPVYYFIAAQFLNFGGAKVVQLFSLICSILSFGVIYYLIK
ncbi:MAG: hypothetical protein NTY48_06665, partial [Candidatus Diapherotrites archaeon]|nr:hypothetical protein [Candidatus Diapherotrites archaeon]